MQTIEELRDVYQHFLLYYGGDLPKMKQYVKAKEAAERGAELDDDLAETIKHAPRKTGFALCQKAGLGEFCLSVLPQVDFLPVFPATSER